MSSSNESVSDSWSNIGDSLADLNADNQPVSQLDDPILELQISQQCDLLHHLIELHNVREKLDDKALLKRNNELINVLLSLPVKSRAKPASELNSNEDSKTEDKPKAGNQFALVNFVVFSSLAVSDPRFLIVCLPFESSTHSRDKPLERPNFGR